MRYRDKNLSSTMTRSIGRIMAVCAIVMAALMVVLFMAIRPAAFAETNVQNANTESQSANHDTKAGTASATVLVYMNGSDLESEAGEATADIAEMVDSGIGTNANVVIETVGTKQWQDFGIASDHTQRYAVENGKLDLVDDTLGQLDTTDPKTLSDFIKWGAENYPAERYILVLWDHGAGPVYGFGYDEFQGDYAALTLDEMKQALGENADVHFDIIGMDCCIMGSLETCLVMQPYCDYTILSEDFEPGIGWSYEGWMGMLEKNPGIDSSELGKAIVDNMISDVASDEENGDATLALIDESAVDELYAAWTDFAYANKDQLLSNDYSQEVEWRDRPSDMQGYVKRPHGHGPSSPGSGYGYGANGNGSVDFGGFDGSAREDGFGYFWEGWDEDESYVTMTDYFVTDIMEVSSSVGGEKASELEAAFKNALAYYKCTSGEQGMSGLAVTLPYGDAEFYDELVKVFLACGIDGEYIDWLESFVEVGGPNGANGADDENESGNGHNAIDGSGSPFGFGADDMGGYDNRQGYENGYGLGGGFGNGYTYGDDFGSYDEHDEAHSYSYGYGYDDGNFDHYGYAHGGSTAHAA